VLLHVHGGADRRDVSPARQPMPAVLVLRYANRWTDRRFIL
jgi:hypothetical protein